MFEKKYQFIFIRKEFGTYNIVFKIQTNKSEKVIRYQQSEFEVKYEFPAFSTQKTKTYIFDFDSGSQIQFNEIQALLNPKELDLFLAQHIIKDLVAGGIADRKEKIMNMIVGAILGGLLSSLLMFFYMQSKIEEIYKSMSVTPIIVGG